MQSTRHAITNGMFAGYVPFLTSAVFLRVFFATFIRILATSCGHARSAKTAAQATGSQASSGLICFLLSGGRTSSRTSRLSASFLAGSRKVTLSTCTLNDCGRLSTTRRMCSVPGGEWKYKLICRKLAVSLSVVRSISTISSSVGPVSSNGGNSSAGFMESASTSVSFLNGRLMSGMSGTQLFTSRSAPASDALKVGLKVALTTFSFCCGGRRGGGGGTRGPGNGGLGAAAAGVTNPCGLGKGGGRCPTCGGCGAGCHGAAGGSCCAMGRGKGRGRGAAPWCGYGGICCGGTCCSGMPRPLGTGMVLDTAGVAPPLVARSAASCSTVEIACVSLFLIAFSSCW
mmetsp:Transcript_29289/g.79079  ORF Transcript_29289/g.79079 Transcript_29289/m.79079 type:complete len:343 (+) Transcript_29289:923-1951(+)